MTSGPQTQDRDGRLPIRAGALAAREHYAHKPHTSDQLTSGPQTQDHDGQLPIRAGVPDSPARAQTPRFRQDDHRPRTSNVFNSSQITCTPLLADKSLHLFITLGVA